MDRSFISFLLRLKTTVFSFQEVTLGVAPPQPAELLARRLNYYVKKGELHQIRRGLYARDRGYDRLELGTKILMPSYISFETILVEAGVIFQYYQTIFVASYQSREIECDGNRYRFRRLKPEILLNSAGVENRGNYFAATPERALLDMLYVTRDYDFTNLRVIDRAKIYELLPLYKNKRMERKIKAHFEAFDER